MLAGQGHLGGRRIGPIALKEAAERYGKAQHHDLQGEERTGRCGGRGGVPDMSQLQAHSRYLKQKRVGGNPRGP